MGNQWISGGREFVFRLLGQAKTSESVFDNIKPEDFASTPRQFEKDNILSSESSSTLKDVDWRKQVKSDFLMEVISETDKLFSWTDVRVDYPYMIEYIMRQQKLGVTSAQEIAQAILISCAEERPGQEIDPFSWPPVIPLRFFEIIRLIPLFNRYVELSIRNDSSEYRALEGLGYVSNFVYHIGFVTDDEPGSMAPEAQLQEHVVLFPQPAIAIGARILESGARMLDSGFWDALDEQNRIFWTTAFTKEGAHLRQLIREYGDTAEPTARS